MNSTAGKIVIRVLLPALALVGIGWFLHARGKASQAAETAQKNAAPRAVPVLVAPVEKRDVPVWLEGLGSVAAFKQVTVHSQVDGRLDQVFFKEGQAVHKGDALAQIDPRPFQVQLHQAEGALARDRAQLAGAQLNLERYRDLRKQNLVAQQQVDDQAALVGTNQGAVLIDEAAVESARLNLNYAHVVSPIDGVVGVRLVDPGNLVHASDPTGLVVITQLEPAAVFLTLPQDDLPRLNEAKDKGELVVEAWSRDGATLLESGELVVIDNQINQSTSTLRLKAVMQNPAHKLWPNQFVKARVRLSTERGAKVIPAAAVQRGPQGTFIYVVDDQKNAAAAAVKVAFVSGDLAVLAEGPDVGKQVVIEGQNQLRPGTPVLARPAKPPQNDKPKGAAK
ncbi:MAG TPA: efflux RND transporter periplasmic adaptor subunit [Polyangia bacterium]|nr:efflux RND transporter periplasmic adaptor subunit [Polyangia bacterium]